MNTNRTYKIIAALLLASLTISCSTEKNTLVNRSFHNLTAYYNIYFNGNEALEEGLYKIETRVEEDYTKILPIFKESMPGTETMVTGDMNRAIEKSTKLIKLKSITAPPEANRRQQDPRKRKPLKPEYNRYVDDAYIMMGRAYLYQKNYYLAANTFSHVIRRFQNEPSKYDAYIWLIRTYNESERFTEARELIDMLEKDDNFPRKLEGELAIVAADLYLKQLRYDEAIQYLSIGVRKIRGNDRKIRYNYILAQLYQEQGNSQRALEAYQRVIRRRPDYEILFNARINSARVFSGEGDVASLRRELNRMSRKKRNEPYLDQIYYALGTILYNEGRINDAVDYFKMSAAASVSNTHQRALSCFTLSDIYFDKRDYVPAGLYHDSAMVLIDDSYPNFIEIERKHQSLSRLVNNLIMVQTQDSLQHLANLSTEELNAKINRWIAEEKMKFDEMEAASATGEYSGMYGRTMTSRMRPGAQGGGWYFYNPSTVAYGKQEFRRLWGERKNEDNWRRNDKSVSLLDQLGEPLEADFEELIEEEIAVRADDPTTREYYLQDIPTTDSLMAVSHKQIRDALFDAAMILKTDFNDFEKSIETYNELNRRYPENMYELPSYFYLWDLYNTVQKPDSAAIFRTAILNKYPQSNYAKYLINPNYFIEEEARKDSMNSVYNVAFNAYRNRDFQRARQYSRMVLTMEPDTALIPKARFIEMVSTSRSLDQSRFADSLKIYIKTYPKAEPAALAKQILGLIEEERFDDYEELISAGYLSDVIRNIELITRSQEITDEQFSKWSTDSDLLHYFIIAFPNDPEINVNRLRFDIANYNIDHYTTLDFDIENELLNTDTRMVVVRNFTSKDAALIYFLSIIRNPEVFKTLAGHQFLNFVVSSSNYREMTNDRAYEQYLSFFVKNYSIYTTGEFPEEELDSPEELMARLSREAEEVDFTERGQFVMVETDESQYVAPEPRDEIFKADYDTPHTYMLMIDAQRFGTGFIMRDMVRYNTNNFRNSRLRVVPNNLNEATLLLVSQFDNAYEAMQYMNRVSTQNDLFTSLGQTSFEHFIISTHNLSQLSSTNNIDEWKRFYRLNYIQRRPPAPRTERPAETTSTQVQTTPEPTEQPSVQAEPVTPSQAEADVTVATESVVESVAEATVSPDPAAQQATTTEETTTITRETYSGIYEYNADEDHKLIYILPSGGSNQTLLITYLGRLNSTRFRAKNIQVDTQEFDEFRTLIVVSGIGTHQEAINYQNEVNADSRISMSLRNVNFRSYLISNNNFDTFKENNDIQGYQKFHSLFY